jgi:Thiamine-binding protein
VEEPAGCEPLSTSTRNDGHDRFSALVASCARSALRGRAVVPIGVGVSVSAYVAACERVLQEAGLSHTLHAFGTNIEGEWDDVFTVKIADLVRL